MMPAQVVITRQNASTPAIGGLFSGISFFLLQRVPMRSTFVERIQANGGRVVKLENQADHIIADHTRPDCPGGSISYTFIDEAIKIGALPNPQDHATRVPKSAAREAGSGAPAKGTRTPFTAEDDRVLWNWVAKSGGLVKGNEIYKSLAEENPRHTWQSWRDRYVKRLAIRPPEGVQVTVPANAPPSPPTAQDEQQEIQAQVVGAAEAVEGGQEQEDEVAEDEFNEDDFDLLLNQADDIEDMDDSKAEAAWSAFAQVYTRHTSAVWLRFWKEVVRPIHLKRKKAEQQAQEEEWKRMTAQDKDEGASTSADGAERRAPSEEGLDSSAVVPSSSQKRKRPAFVSPAKRSRGKKRRKSEDEVPEPSGSKEQDETPVAVSDQPLPTSELNRNANIQLRQEADVTSEQPVPTSELNRSAQKQLRKESGISSESALPELPVQETIEDPRAEAQAKFDEEVLGITRQHEPVAPGPSNLPTSDINNAADQQLTQESLERGDEDGDELDESSELKTVSVSSEDDEDVHEVIQGQEDELAPEDELDTPSAPLTEANLASQQAQQKEPLIRGADLPADNDAQDGDQQDEFVRYLQRVTATSGGTEAMPAITYESQAPVALESLLPEDGLLPFDSLDSANIDELPIVSQQEIDEAMDGMIHWPSSPEISQRREVPESQSQSQRMETQIPYPALPAQPHRISPLEQEAMFSSQPSMEAVYPRLPLQQALSPRPRHGEERFRDEDNGGLGTSEESMSSEQNVEEQENVDVDFSIPTPIGGWSFSPAKAQSSQATPIASQRQIRIKQEPRLPDDSPIRSQVVNAQEVVEVSSTSSSSSSSSEDEEEPAASTPTAPPRRRALETQDILDAETQLPDFDLPLPPDSPNPSSSVLNPSSSPLPHATESQPALAETQRLEDEDVETFITTRIVVDGFKEPDIIAALKCTSMRGDLATHVLRSQRAGLGFPITPGTWSEEEDKVLESGNAKALRKLEQKHTWAEMEARLQFLEDWREESEADE